MVFKYLELCMAVQDTVVVSEVAAGTYCITSERLIIFYDEK